MPSPLPGMDPYLEHPDVWPTFHPLLIDRIAETLNETLPDRYVARVGQRIYVLESERSVYPDVSVIEHPRPLAQAPGGGTVAVADPADPPWIVLALPTEVREVFVEILPVADQTRVVTVIEALSYANKARGTPGRELYLAKQRELLQSDTHLIEIDLLRVGEHTVAAPRHMLNDRGPWDYLVCLHRSGERNRYEVWPVLLRHRLPRIHVPLSREDTDIILDLQPVFARSYDAGAYGRTIDYRRDPQPPLGPEDGRWADEWLREHGLR